jgi:hypothetical protein
MPFIGVGKAGAETRTPLAGDGVFGGDEARAPGITDGNPGVEMRTPAAGDALPGGDGARAPYRGAGLPDGVAARTALCVITALRGGAEGGASACVSGA